ncbi:regulation of enolase protein 1 (concanavalin A-like superfamily) [Crossiella equi]|uniref:Regulation of enolase protein 1 (Concanavalin A-like superfamily) n=1 Tax=Crossiella equi TaxID=130796 RepID=A0ABS5A4E0_9PSEU|nr:DUF1349 domain-containing protein [Crossiella equi]MBP2471439.1 regulation of enolase protein 1 (concanavalin A-like superfamily) [Crossiella equi]
MSATLGGADWAWLNEPPQWTIDGGTLTVRTAPDTDFWRITHYGFIRDTGHFLGRRVTGDFTARVRFRGDYHARYDQAGLMVRVDERNWLKTGIELDGRQWLSAVATREYSDWSVLPAPDGLREVSLELERKGDTVTVRYGVDGAKPETMLRLAYLPPKRPAWIGPMCCSPDGTGFTATFTDFELLD